MITSLLIIVVVAAVMLFLGHLENDGHQWKYHNPFNRTCTTCDRNEQEECWGEDFERKGFAARGQWVVYREGDPKKHQ